MTTSATTMTTTTSSPPDGYEGAQPPPPAAPSIVAGTGLLPALLASLFLTLYTLSVALVPIRADNDVWWHVKSGMYISQHGIPETDVFNFNAEGLPWHNHEWLSQVLFWQAWRAADAVGADGFIGVILLTGAVIWATTLLVFLFARRLSGSAWIALLVAVLSVAISRRMFYPRPPVISNLLLIAQIYLLVGVNQGWFARKWLFALPIAIALWSNLHGGWMAGGVLLAAWTVDHLLAAFRGAKASSSSAFPLRVPAALVPFRTLAFLLPLSLFATFCNPYTYHLYALPKRVLTDTDLVRSIGELRSPDFYFVVDFELAVLAAIAMALVAARRIRTDFFELAIFLFFLHQAFQHVRHLSLFAIMMVPLYTRLLAAFVETGREWWAVRPALSRAWSVKPAAIALVVAAWVVVNPREGGQWTNPFTPASYPGRNLQFLSGLSYIRERFPAHVADFIELAELRGRMFNENYYSGYLIWRLSPEPHKVFTDSRFDIFAGRIKRIEETIVSGSPEPVQTTDGTTKEAWQHFLDEAGVQWAIARAGTGLGIQLSRSDLWAKVADWPDGFQIWVRATPENADMISRARSSAMVVGAGVE